jgi:thiamine-phosphate diphosphorylase/hydroxyethylthiazole kinase
MAPLNVDYSVYLVTDSTPAILGDKDLVAVVKAAVDGGNTASSHPLLHPNTTDSPRCNNRTIP